ncbi:MAG: hypothetical protein E7Z89_06450 [Cyanobacteria bacterium SIG28]|nr:hypothetical protein [Cyanobacteria bacterium SIG28]
MITFKEIEDNLKSFIIQEQSDAHNIKTANITKYNNLKIGMNPRKFVQPHIIVRISISEAVFSLSDFSKINGGLGYEERLVIKWFGRYGIKEKLRMLWDDNSSALMEEEDKQKK